MFGIGMIVFCFSVGLFAGAYLMFTTMKGAMMPEDSKVDFCTDRLWVFRHDIELPTGTCRSVYHAWLLNEDEMYSRPICTATVNHSLMDFLEWVEVTAQFRRRGFATELLRGIEQRYGLMMSDGATPEGEAFSEAWDNAITDQ